jgi:iron complex outermembrane receptor protein
MSELRYLHLLTVSMVSIWAGVASAQTGDTVTPAANAPVASASQEGLSEVVVTGSRLRQEPVQQTPIAVSVVGAPEIEALHSVDVSALSSVVPNLQITSSEYNPGQAEIFLRGFGTTSSDLSNEPGIAVYVDGVYQSVQGGSLANLDDIQSIEVLRGPQGTLLGKNASAGAVLITHTLPTGQWGGAASVEYGTFNLTRVNGLLNFPIVDGVLAGKIYANYTYRDNYDKTVLSKDGINLDGLSNGTVRTALLFTPEDNFKFYVTGDYQGSRNSEPGSRDTSKPYTLACQLFKFCNSLGNRYDVNSEVWLPTPHVDDFNLSGKADWDLRAVTLTSITGYRNYHQYDPTQVDSTPLALLIVGGYANGAPTGGGFVQNVIERSEEIRIASDKNGGLDLGGKLDWLLGLYYNKTDGTESQPLTAFFANSDQDQRVVRDTKAVFLHADYSVIDPLTFQFGVRHSWDFFGHNYGLPLEGELSGATDPYYQSANFGNTSFEAGLQFQFDSTKMAYFRFAQGYRGGGFVGLPASAAEAAVGKFEPEHSNSYEIGLKTQWFDKALLVNVAIFDTRFTNLQHTLDISNGNGGFIQSEGNVPLATSKGVELESMLRPSQNFDVRFNVGYVSANLSNYPVVGAGGITTSMPGGPFPWTPRFTVSLTPEYNFDFNRAFAGFDRVNVQSTVNWKTAAYISFPTAPDAIQGEYATVDASVNLLGRTSPFKLTFYAKNLLNKHYSTYIDNLGYGATAAGVPNFGYFDGTFDGLPLTVGIILSGKF